MKEIISLVNTTIKKVAFTLLCLFLLNISCTKEQSAVAPPPPPPTTELVSIFTNNQFPAGQTENDDTGGIEVGVKFQSTVAGYADGIKFYKTPGNIGTHTGQLYSSDGKLLASEVFINETDSGWQRVLFATAVPIAAYTTYIAAYHSSLGYYILTAFGLKTAITNGPLTALADSTDGINGLFKYTNTPDLPGRGYLSSNYWVDVIEKINNNNN
jgi:Domain of unknown function (DUF4082)